MQYVRGVVGKGGLRMLNCDGFGLGGALVFCVCVCVLVFWSCGRVSRSNGDADLGRRHDSLAKCLRESFGDSVPRRGVLWPKISGTRKNPRILVPKSRGPIASESP